jgi:hypothetical protein
MTASPCDDDEDGTMAVGLGEYEFGGETYHFAVSEFGYVTNGFAGEAVGPDRALAVATDFDRQHRLRLALGKVPADWLPVHDDLAENIREEGIDQSRRLWAIRLEDTEDEAYLVTATDGSLDSRVLIADYEEAVRLAKQEARFGPK